MRQPAIFPGPRWSAVAVAALLTLGGIAPVRALASCGDYVTVMPRHGSAGHDEVPLLSIGSFMTDHDSSIPALPQLGAAAWEHHRSEVPTPSPCRQCPYRPADPGSRPCEGPWCSGTHGPMHVPPPSVQGPLETKGLPGAPAGHDGLDPFACAHLRDQAQRVHHVFPIYHPPRHA